MRHMLCRFLDMSLLVAALAALAAPLRAQDPVRVGPDIYKCTFENERVRVCEVTFKPGAKIATHSHPNHLVLRCKPSGRARCSEDGRSRVPVESDLGGGGVPFRRISLELGTERAG